MARTALTYLARPNVASLGYALFLAINAAGVWGGVFPFLPLDFQTPEIIFWFFLAQSLVFSLCYCDEIVRYILMTIHLYTGKWIRPVTPEGKAVLDDFRRSLGKRRPKGRANIS